MTWTMNIAAMSTFIALLSLCKGQVEINSYGCMPQLYVFDDYNKCIHNLNQTYCMIYLEIIPDKLSSLWRQIEEFSESYQFHYRHDHLFRGMCLRNNTEFFAETRTIPCDNFTKNEITQNFQRVFNKSEDDFLKTTYQNEIRKRLYDEFRNKYNLSFDTLTLYCDSAVLTWTKDNGFKISIWVCVIINLLNILSSLYDGWLKSQQTTETSRFLKCFSIRRNFYRLLRPNKSDVGMDLQFLDGFRATLAFLIVYEHSYYIQFVHLKNTEFFENLYHQFITKLMLHGLMLVELFFVLSGLMLFIKMENGLHITKDTSLVSCGKVYGKLLLSRYMRYLPSLAFLLLVNANILLFLQTGPFWRFMMESNYFYCSKYWWKNILMINNFDISNSCLNHTWYIAADFQLYAFYLMVLICTKKHPKYKTYTFIIIGIVSAVTPVLINFLHKLSSIAFMKLESFRYFYLIDIETGSQLYIPSYTNLHGYLVGIICGEFYMKLKRQNTRHKKAFGKILKYSPYLGWPCIMGIFAIGTLALERKPSIWSAFYGLLQRHVALIILTTITVLQMMSQRGKICKILSSLPFRLLARISFQVYLWHFNILLVIINYFSQPINVTYYLLLVIFIVTYFTANIFAIIFAVTIEYPVAELLNLLNLK